jgi:hypothetical protein
MRKSNQSYKAVIEYTDRRPGDPVRLVALSQKKFTKNLAGKEYSLRRHYRKRKEIA